MSVAVGESGAHRRLELQLNCLASLAACAPHFKRSYSQNPRVYDGGSSSYQSLH